MKKMNKMYEAPVAEAIEMQMPAVLMDSLQGSNTGNAGTGNLNGSGF